MTASVAPVAAIVLAAGRGTRFGSAPKLLALLAGKPLVRHAVEAALDSGADPVIVVTGHRGREVAAAIADLPVTMLDNALHIEGLSTSLKLGFASLPAEAPGAVVLLADMPRVSASLIDDIVTAWDGAGRPVALVPSYRGRRGNPVLLSRALAPEIARLEGDAGAGRLLRQRAGVLEWESGDAAVDTDVDTPEALAQAAWASTTPPSTAE